MYVWYFVASVSVLMLSIAFTILKSLRPNNRVRLFKSFYALTIGIFLAITLLFIPINYQTFKNYPFAPATTIFSALHTAIRFFIVDCDFELITAGVEGLSEILQKC